MVGYMIPILFEKTATTFDNNGIGRLSDLIDIEVTEARNGEYVLDMKYPMTGMYYDRLEQEMIVYAKPSDGEGPQPFSIYQISAPINGIVSVHAQHISYLLNKMIVMPFEADTCQEAMSMIPSNVIGGTNFAFWTDKSVIGRFSNDEPRPVRGMLGGERNSILDVYGKGDYEFDHFTVKLHVNRGRDNGVTLRYGKNITELENTIDMSNVYTGIVPFWKDEDEIALLPEKVVWSEHTGQYARRLVKAVDFSGEWENMPSEAQLRERARRYVTNNEGWVLKQNVKVSFVNLIDTEEYKDIVSLERVRLCDTVTIIDTPLGVNVKAKVIRTVYDSLNERYKEIELGETRPNLKTVIEEQVRDPIIAQTSSRMQAAIQAATNLITGGKGGYLIINQNDDGTPNELLIMNTPDKNTATQVLRINKNGIGFGKSYEGPFNTAWTLDGHFVANYIDTGTLNADLIRVGVLRALENDRNYWNMKTGEFHLRSNNVNQGIDFKNGVLTINATNITTGALNASLITTGSLSANRIRSGVIVSNDGLCKFDLDGAYVQVSSGDGTEARLYDGYLTCTANSQQWKNKPVKIEVNTSNFNNLLVRDNLYAQGEVTVGTTKNRKNFYVNGDAYIYGIISATYNITTSAGMAAGSDISSGGVMRASDFVRTSDRERKTDIEGLVVEESISFIMGLIPRSYRLKKAPQKKHHGFVAQEVKEVMLDDWGVYDEFCDAEGNTCGISYDEIIADLVAVVQRQEKRINELEDRIIALGDKT